ncbi:glutamate receptor ionotropic, kainate 4-like [Portunus trituberculatus]|uniref:glutamate receptor ionotropic, kainate 4-like n=1 Tax=Portunus trituberculatus TaxID=210409 RepID=UPI001E1CE707|nr:glutamate receptor ionotropic, kainate 4-like [Portunus trituberculatus]
MTQAYYFLAFISKYFPRLSDGFQVFLSPPDQFQDCRSHAFQVVSMDWFPFLSFSRDTQRPGTTVTPQDSVDVRMLQAVARTLNFTYVMRVPEDGQWGVLQKDGLWTGTVGTLQRRLADFSMLLNWSSKRFHAIDFSRIYAAEPLVIVSTQPRPRPHYLALVAPFTC